MAGSYSPKRYKTFLMRPSSTAYLGQSHRCGWDFDRLGLSRPSGEAALLSMFAANDDVNEVYANINTSMQQLPALEDTLDLNDLEVEFVVEQWFNPEYMDGA
jgi:hypothetical protein